MYDAALELVWEGAAVLPLHTPTRSIRAGCSCMRMGCGKTAGKHPRTARGLLDATDDAETVASWWRCWPLANVGVRPRPGQIVVDVDPRNNGDRALTEWQAEHGVLPPTRTAVTGGGGQHLWFAIPAGTKVLGGLCPGVDLKTESGFVVMPPSRHLSGRRYTWSNPGDIMEAPPELLQAVTRPPVVAPWPAERTADSDRRMAGMCRALETAEPGRHNDTLFRMACHAARAGLDSEPLRATALRVGSDPAHKVDSTLASAARAVAQQQVRR